MRAIALVITFCLTAMPLWADARVTVLMDALRLPDLIQTIRAEGLRDAQAINEDMLDGQGGPFWEAQVHALYDPVVMTDVLFRALQQGLDDDALDAAVAFFDSLRGQRIMEMEIAARQAMMDEAVQEASIEAYDTLAASDDPHAALVAQFVQTNDLLELNVAVAMSSSYQFYRGMADGGLLKSSESDILSDVWASEGTVRNEARDWLFGYFMLAYQPLDLADLQAYLAFSESPAGQALNTALIFGSETMFKDIAYGLGRAVAMNAVGNDI
ncbi:DUF2059 domain-containing protein [uncultured Roseobacter sp.]|uniref:DUF2059 domain-containing protein n=1 Tax=uncultured Roseobacter sp. TaxID=114847 RepID=UPI00260DCBAB|nr:DUF2059 domain-containing protein [uncultured Roseobacter sp.]